MWLWWARAGIKVFFDAPKTVPANYSPNTLCNLQGHFVEREKKNALLLNGKIVLVWSTEEHMELQNNKCSEQQTSSQHTLTIVSQKKFFVDEGSKLNQFLNM